MSKYRVFSMLCYGVATLVGTAVLLMTTFAAAVVVALPFAMAAAVDRFINYTAEPDDRLRSFSIYALGAIAGLLVILIYRDQIGGWASAGPLVGFGLAALFDYFVAP